MKKRTLVTLFLMISLAMSSFVLAQENKENSFVDSVSSFFSRIFNGITGKVIEEPENKTLRLEGIPRDVDLDKIRFRNDTSGEILTAQEAIDLGWIDSVDGTIEGMLFEYSEKEKTIVPVKKTQEEVVVSDLKKKSFFKPIQSFFSRLSLAITGNVVKDEDREETVIFGESQQEPIVSTMGGGTPIDINYNYKVEEVMFRNSSDGTLKNITEAITAGWAISSDGTLGGVFHAWVPEIQDFVTVDPTHPDCSDLEKWERYPWILCELESWRGYFFQGGASGIEMLFLE